MDWLDLDVIIEEFAKLAEIDTSQFQQLGQKSFFNKIESLLTPTVGQEDPDVAAKAQAATNAERDYFRKRYNVTARLTGSMPLKLGVPGDVDLDFYSRIKSPKKFNTVVAKLESNPDYIGSKYNKPGAAFQVFQRQARGDDDFPVDFAVAYGPEADRLAGQLKQKEQVAAQLPPDVRQQLVEKKMVLKHTPFDIKHKRYKAWKRNLDQALGGGEVIRLQRQPHPDLIAALEKQGAVVDLNDPASLKKFESFAKRKDVYGHRTPHAESVLEGGHIISAMEALRRGKIKSVETGVGVGARKEIGTNNLLSGQQLDKLENAFFGTKVDDDAATGVAVDAGVDYNQMMSEFIRRRHGSIKRHLGQMDNAESFRRKHLSIPKLGPNIFVTKGGVMDEPRYGDVSMLVRTRSVVQSPFANVLTNEHIVEPKRPMEPRRINVSSGFVIAKGARVDALNKQFPNFQYVKEEQIPDELRKDIFKPTRSVSEVATRIIPKILSGELRLRNR